MKLIGILLLIAAIALIVVGVAAWTRRLPGNSVVGLHVPEVRKSRELWDRAHQVAGPLWTGAGLLMGIAGFVALSASGWLWAIVGLLVVGSLAFVGIGGGMGAHTVALIDAANLRQQAQDEGGCSCGGEGEAAAGPQVDLSAARRAAERADGTGAGQPQQ